jgi:hypothetical protein
MLDMSPETHVGIRVKCRIIIAAIMNSTTGIRRRESQPTFATFFHAGVLLG